MLLFFCFGQSRVSIQVTQVGRGRPWDVSAKRANVRRRGFDSESISRLPPLHLPDELNDHVGSRFDYVDKRLQRRAVFRGQGIATVFWLPSDFVHAFVVGGLS